MRFRLTIRVERIEFSIHHEGMVRLDSPQATDRKDQDGNHLAQRRKGAKVIKKSNSPELGVLAILRLSSGHALRESIRVGLDIFSVLLTFRVSVVKPSFLRVVRAFVVNTSSQ